MAVLVVTDVHALGEIGGTAVVPDRCGRGRQVIVLRRAEGRLLPLVLPRTLRRVLSFFAIARRPAAAGMRDIDDLDAVRRQLAQEIARDSVKRGAAEFAL